MTSKSLQFLPTGGGRGGRGYILERSPRTNVIMSKVSWLFNPDLSYQNLP